MAAEHVVLVCAIVFAVQFAKRLRVRLIGMLSMVLLFSQIAVAAYACPAMSGQADRDQAGMADMAGMPCAAMMAAGIELDPEQPLLCHQHCQFGSTNQAVDHVLPLLASSTDLPATLIIPPPVEQDHVLASRAGSDRQHDRPPPPPHSIVHCCYRI